MADKDQEKKVNNNTNNNATNNDYEVAQESYSFNEILSVHTGQPIDRILEDTDRDFILTPDEAVQYGVIDQVITKRIRKED